MDPGACCRGRQDLVKMAVKTKAKKTNNQASFGGSIKSVRSVHTVCIQCASGLNLATFPPISTNVTESRMKTAVKTKAKKTNNQA